MWQSLYRLERSDALQGVVSVEVMGSAWILIMTQLSHTALLAEGQTILKVIHGTAFSNQHPMSTL